ncbi:hypothetical protein KX816_05000 [Sphingosinicellaceae bacterium]|nr:hypothetical protein KX816_05000 [Sphingosinicellaceae bacterium]
MKNVLAGPVDVSAGEPVSDIDRQVHIMTTMHFVITGARATTVTEAVGRSGMYLTSVSMTLVALGFISTATQMGTGFYVFAFVLLSCLVPLGIVTFNRVVQTGVQDLRLSYNEARIWAFYADVSPGLDRWFDHPVGDAHANHDLFTAGGSKFQMLFTAASMVGGVSSAVIAVLVSLAVARSLHAGLLFATIAGVIAFAVAGWIHLRVEAAHFAALERFKATMP